MKLPNAKEYKPKGAYLQELLDEATLSQSEAADVIGVDHRTMRRYVLGETRFPYTVQYAVEVLRDARVDEAPKVSHLRKMKREELEAELTKWRAEQNQHPNASRKYARASKHVEAIYAELNRRVEKRAAGAK